MSDPIFSPGARRTLAAVLDEIIPPREDGSLPGAGALGVGVHVEEKLGDAGAPVAAALVALEQHATEAGAASYASSPRDERITLLNRVAESHPGFLGGLIFHAYGGYYQSQRVVDALGLEAWPPHPDGYELEAGDLGRLEAVRARRKLYRDA